MDSEPVRRFAVGPFRDAAALAPLGLTLPETEPADIADPAANRLIPVPDGVWLSTPTIDLRDRAIALAGTTYTIVTIECWNAVADRLTIGRLRVERHLDDVIEREMNERRHPEYVPVEALDGIAIDWLARKVSTLARRTPSHGPSKKERDQRERSEQFLFLLVDRAILELAPGSTVADLGDRTRRILFTIARSRVDASSGITRMFRDSKHVAEFRGGPAEIAVALEEIRYRR